MLKQSEPRVLYQTVCDSLWGCLLQFHRLLKQQLSAKEWEKKLPPPPSKTGVSKLVGWRFYLCSQLQLLVFVPVLQEGVLLYLCHWQGLRLRAGIVGIERNIEKKQQQTGQQVSQAFKDLDALIDKASLPQLNDFESTEWFVMCRLRIWSVW